MELHWISWQLKFRTKFAAPEPHLSSHLPICLCCSPGGISFKSWMMEIGYCTICENNHPTYSAQEHLTSEHAWQSPVFALHLLHWLRRQRNTWKVSPIYITLQDVQSSQCVHTSVLKTQNPKTSHLTIKDPYWLVRTACLITSECIWWHNTYHHAGILLYLLSIYLSLIFGEQLNLTAWGSAWVKFTSQLAKVVSDPPAPLL